MNKYLRSYLIIIALLIGLIGGMLNYQLVVPVSGNRYTPYYHGIRGKDEISLTINVDWGREYIPEILTILDKHNIKITFFVTGNWAKKNPELLQKMARAGHEIGNHGYSHQHPEKLDQQGIIDLIRQNEDLIYEITGQKTNLFAPPYGEVDNRITSIAASLGYKTIMWSADTIDWQRPDPQIIVYRAVSKIEDGGIILMHPTTPSVKALPEIISQLKKRGFNFVPVSKLIKKG